MKRISIYFLTLFLMNLSVHAEAKEAIAYAHLTNDYWQIWMMDPDGSNKHQITYSNFDKRDPAWLNDGKRLAFRTNNGELYLVNLDGKEETEILEKYKTINNPNISYKTGEIIFVRFDPRGKDLSDIWKSDLKGENTKLLTHDSLGKFQPRFSRQSDKITFVKADPDRLKYHVWVMNADGSAPRQLTQGRGFDIHPDFSADGKTIIYSSNHSENNFEIYSVDVETKRTKQLTHYAGLDTQANYSLDGKRIVFVSNRSGSQQVWGMNSDGTTPNQLTHEDTESIDPAWGNIEEIKGN